MREVHLICNAHLDPIWQWEWEEGAAAALSTFKSAADLADEFDYIFCHNEVTLYKYIEEYAPALFERIKELIRVGKWHIMGGWYLQPDCNMPQGESFIRQIQVGHMYFKEKFNEDPKTVINFDSFGHTRGLVQIVKKCGMDSYILCRGGTDPLPARQMMWKGFDDSQIKLCIPEWYNSELGNSRANIERKIEKGTEDVICVLWGVGNHGGGPSRKDLADIKDLIENGDMKILHSTPENFFASIDPKVVHDKSIRISMPGCYTTMSRIKQKHAQLENELYMIEKLCSVAAMRGLIEYPKKELDEVVEDLLNCEFHDVLPGSSIRAGEENGLRIIEHGLLILNHLRARAYFALSSMEKKAAEGEFPMLVVNPNPYEWETEVTCEMMLADQNRSLELHNFPKVYDEDGNLLPSQVVKEESNLNMDWRKRILFKAKLKPLSITRFSIFMELKPPMVRDYKQGGDIVLDVPELKKHVEIDGKTGLLRSYKIGDKEYVSGNAFRPVMYKDNPDPWGMGEKQLIEMGEDPVPFKLMEKPYGPFAGMEPVRIIEDGDICLSVESFFECENTSVRVEYMIYKTNSAIDVKVDTFLNDAYRMIKLEVPTAVKGQYIGQTAFGIEDLYMDARECVAQRYVAMRPEDGSNCLVLFNRGTYGSSWKNGVISMSLLRSCTYCAHPLEDRDIIPRDRFVKLIDMGERNFSFRLDVAPEKSLERLASEYNMPPYACNVFPIESGVSAPEFELSISDRDIVLVALKKADMCDGYVIRLVNNYGESTEATLCCNGAKLDLCFGKYEVKTVLYNGSELRELDRLYI